MKSNIDKLIVIPIITVLLGVFFVSLFRPLGADELYFLHYAWLVDQDSSQLYSGYPFPAAINIYSRIYGVFGFSGVYYLKFVFAASYLLIFRRYLKGGGIRGGFASVILVLLVSHRALDLRPEMFATFFMASAACLAGYSELKGGAWWARFMFLLLCLASVFFSPRFFVLPLFLFLFHYASPGFELRRWAVVFFAATLVFIFAYVFFIGDPLETFRQLFSLHDYRAHADFSYKLSRIFGPKFFLPLIVFFVSLGAFYRVRAGLYKRESFLFIFGVLAYVFFVVVADRFPYEYVALPLVIYVGAVGFFLLKDFDIGSGKGRRVGWALMGFVVVAQIYYLKDLAREFRVALSRLEVASGSREIKLRDLVEPKGWVPTEHFRILNFVCDKYAGYYFFTNRYKYSPVCLNDQYSVSVWTKEFPVERVKSELAQAADMVVIKNDIEAILFLYKKD